jgi:predicted RNA binding protein YcfA (HicA-like mRNA interferase family)
MTDYTREIRRQLTDAGWRFQRHGKGDHERWINPATGEKVTVDSKVRSRAVANKIMKEAGLEKKF